MLGTTSRFPPACVGRRSSSTQQPPALLASARCRAGPPSLSVHASAAVRAAAACQRATFESSCVAVTPAGAGRRRAGAWSRGCCVRVSALDAAQPFDFEARMTNKLSADKALTIGIVGFGTFGQFLAKRMVEAGHRVLATSRTPYYTEAAEMGAEFFEDANDFCEEHPDVVILATSILSTEPVLRALPLARLKRSTLVVDVLSVKVFPKQLLMALLPPELDILCTHPMFGPDSGKGSWEGLNLMWDAVRVGAEPKRRQRLETFLAFFRGQGCRMVEMTCEEHDRQAASTQFVTHTVGRMLGAMDLTSTEINTRGYEALLQLVENTKHDSFELYYGLFLYNTNATDELERLEKAFDVVKKQLFGRLHAIARKSLLPDPSATPPAAAAAATPAGKGGAANGSAAPRSNGHSSNGGSSSSSDAGDSSSSAPSSRSNSSNNSVASLASLAAAASVPAAAAAAAANSAAAGKLKSSDQQVPPAANGQRDPTKQG